MAENTNTVSVQNETDVDLLYFLKTNKKNIENMVGAPLSSLSLTYSDADGFKVEYTKRATVTTVTTP